MRLTVRLAQVAECSVAWFCWQRFSDCSGRCPVIEVHQQTVEGTVLNSKLRHALGFLYTLGKSRLFFVRKLWVI